jgi:uncharacterized protein YjeT (DUF2065 family)
VLIQDLMTAFALLLMKTMRELSKYDPRAIRVGGIISMLAGAVLLQFLK